MKSMYVVYGDYEGIVRGLHEDHVGLRVFCPTNGGSKDG